MQPVVAFCGVSLFDKDITVTIYQSMCIVWMLEIFELACANRAANIPTSNCRTSNHKDTRTPLGMNLHWFGMI